MCLGGGQPQAPTNKADYLPEDAGKQVRVVSQKAGEDEKVLQKGGADTNRGRTTTPKVKINKNPIRM